MTFYPKKYVRQRYGDKSDMTLWRWLNDPRYAELGFPKPVYINGRPHWTDEQLDEFDRRLTAASEAA